MRSGALATLRLLALAALLLVCPRESAAQYSSLARTYRDGLGNSLPYRLFVPPGHDTPGAEFPIVVHLHGAGERGTNNSSQLLFIDGLIEETQTEHPAYLLVPQAPNGTGWSSFGSAGLSTPSQMTIDLIGLLEQQYGVDSSRRYVTGLSMGGFGTYDMIGKLPDFFDAAAPMSAYGDPSRADALVDTRIWTFHGAADDIVPVEPDRATIQAIRNAGGSPIYSETNDGHGNWTSYYHDPQDELYDWMFDDVQPSIVDFRYDPATGTVEIDPTQAPGGILDRFLFALDQTHVLVDPANAMSVPDFVLLDGTPVPTADVLQVRPSGTLGFNGRNGSLSGVLQIPGLLPAGYDFLTLSDVTSRQYYYAAGTGSARRYFSLTTGPIAGVPEPSTFVLIAGLGLLALGVRRRSA